MYDDDSIWLRKGATLSDKSARQEFGLTQQEIFAAIRAGKLQFRENNMHGNPWFRLLRTKSKPWSARRVGRTTCARRNCKKSWPTSTKKPGS